LERGSRPPKTQPAAEHGGYDAIVNPRHGRESVRWLLRIKLGASRGMAPSGYLMLDAGDLLRSMVRAHPLHRGTSAPRAHPV